MFGLGWQELLLILFIVLIIFGPEKMPLIGKSIGKSIRNLKNAVNGFDIIEEDSSKIEEEKVEEDFEKKDDKNK